MYRDCERLYEREAARATHHGDGWGRRNLLPSPGLVVVLRDLYVMRGKIWVQKYDDIFRREVAAALEKYGASGRISFEGLLGVIQHPPWRGLLPELDHPRFEALLTHGPPDEASSDAPAPDTTVDSQASPHLHRVQRRAPPLREVPACLHMADSSLHDRGVIVGAFSPRQGPSCLDRLEAVKESLRRQEAFDAAEEATASSTQEARRPGPLGPSLGDLAVEEAARAGGSRAVARVRELEAEMAALKSDSKAALEEDHTARSHLEDALREATGLEALPQQAAGIDPPRGANRGTRGPGIGRFDERSSHDLFWSLKSLLQQGLVSYDEVREVERLAKRDDPLLLGAYDKYKDNQDATFFIKRLKLILRCS